MARSREDVPANVSDEIAVTVSRVRRRSAGLIARAAAEGWSDGRLHQEIRREFSGERELPAATGTPQAEERVAPPEPEEPQSRPGRFRVGLAVSCETRDAFLSGRVTNISRGGLFIRSDHPLPLQSEVDLEFTLPGTGHAIRTTGRVIWNYDMAKGSSRIVPGSGIKFVDLSPADRALLEACLERLASSSTPA